MQKILVSLLLIVLLSGCSVFAGGKGEGSLQNYQPIETQHVLELLCNSSTNCIE